MRIWSGASKQARMGKPEDTQSLLPGQAPPEQAVNDIETGVHLVELDEAALDFSLQPNAPRELQIAFHNYLREKPPGVPDNIKLKGYQMLGLNWLRLLHSKGLSCILADEMGRSILRILSLPQVSMAVMQVSARPVRSSLSSRISKQRINQVPIWS